ncbi:3-hydroxyisobutyrate dehydrogenase [Rathayibacter oskolensis]|uniref:3-hydroxyisobutyrate dehydrogenase n=1 Tax=Rathayibacter oskolensis TaxID=1891671 RepID=A0A1X7PDM7_9MICO|nr:NAD(P)-binding domain-containing protein [Rathayibacter oskolensis]SMH48841.1 3-hydroxyisobutyrate dehydrogenase [Rathayibacter oskolensis]
MSASHQLGFLGLGNLGLAMALRLIDSGFAVVAHDPSADRVDRVERAGATAGSAHDVLDCPTVCVATPDERALEALLDDGTLTAGSGARTVLLHSTVLPTAARSLAARLAESGIALIEAPVSGGPAAARDGRLALFLGGDDETIAHADTVLAALGDRRFRLGPVGAGSAVKLANQLTMFAAVDALHEGLALTGAFDVDPSAALEAIAASTGDTWVGRHWGFFDDIVADYDSSGSSADGRPWRKDLREFIDAAHSASLSAPLGEHLHATVGDRIEADARAHLEGRTP